MLYEGEIDERDREAFILLNYDAEGADLQGSSINPPLPKGMSGCGIWRLHDPENLPICGNRMTVNWLAFNTVGGADFDTSVVPPSPSPLCLFTGTTRRANASKSLSFQGIYPRLRSKSPLASMSAMPSPANNAGI